MKIPLHSNHYLGPMPTVLVGANVDGKPNYMAVAWVGIMDFDFVSVAIHRGRHTYGGIVANRTFSINIPSFDLVQETDFCGMVSGKDFDKGALFESFYGQLGTAPMIQQCPINIECRLVHTLDIFPTHDAFIGQVVEVYGDEAYMADGEIDIAKVRPILFVQSEPAYWQLGERFGKLGSAGRELKARLLVPEPSYREGRPAEEDP
jgi:flavin reductase (DIM6/NTAB) family NADH-FMN oxidoreductase RutF